MEISRFKVPLDENGLEIVVDIKDNEARQTLAEISQHIGGSMSYLGETMTPIISGSSINPIEINGEEVTVIAGTCVSSRGGVYLYTGTRWQEFGTVAALRALAYKDEVEAEYTPEGTITRQTFTGKTATMTASIIPRGRIDIAQEDAEEDEVNFVAKGTVTAPSVTVVPETTTIISATTAGRPPRCTFPTLGMRLDGEGIFFEWVDGSFDAGTSSSGSEEVTVVTGIREATVSQPVFHGTPQKLTGSFLGQGSQVDLDYTPEGEISTARFEGKTATIRSS